ncbi:MAG: hypothetical protein WAX85_01845 [Minisyncoccia bacterium]
MGDDAKIKDTTLFLMIAVALSFDFLQALIGWIPIVGNIMSDLMSVFICLTFVFWFMMVGIKISQKRIMALVGGGAVEIIPFINILPAWTAVVVYIVGTTRIKELTAEHPKLARGAMAAGGKIKSMAKGKTEETESETAEVVA